MFKTLFNRLWDNKPCKIAEIMVTKSNIETGLTMTDIKILSIIRIRNEAGDDIHTCLYYFAESDIGLLWTVAPL